MAEFRVVWDPWIRIFHWALVVIVAANQFFIGGGGSVHDWLGYLACALIVWRIYWGFRGPADARFSTITEHWPAKGAFFPHLKEYLRGKTPRTIAHSPLATLVMGAMLLCLLLLGLTGWMLDWDRFFGEEWLESTHEIISYVLLALIGGHIVGVLRHSYLHRENLTKAMFTGKKRVE